MKSQTDSPNVITFPPLIYIGGLLLGLLLRYIIPLQVLDGKLSILGWVFIVLSIILLIMSTKFFVKEHTNIDVRKPTTSIITSGPYRFSRNPIYLSMTIFYLGITILIGDLWLLFILIPILLTIQYGVIKHEEHYLTKKFGEKYTTYKESVRRWL